MRQLRRLGLVQPGKVSSGVVSFWRNQEVTGSVRVIMNLDDVEYGVAALDYSVKTQRYVTLIDLESIPCRFGGRRFYFICPCSGRRCEVLCSIGGEFASRQHHRLTYFSTTETALERLGRAKRQAEKKALGLGNHPIPRGENRERRVARWHELKAAWDLAYCVDAKRRFPDLFETRPNLNGAGRPHVKGE